MVGHTGSIPAVVKAVETADSCLARVVAAVHEAGGACLITADHGNAEIMLEPDGVSPHTAHTTSPSRSCSRPARSGCARAASCPTWRRPSLRSSRSSNPPR